MTIRWEMISVLFAIIAQSMAGMYWGGRMSERMASVERLLVEQKTVSLARGEWATQTDNRLMKLETTVDMISKNLGE